MFASLTLLFIYLPSLNVLAFLLGPRTAGAVGFVWGIVMGLVGAILTNMSVAKVVGLFLTFLGVGIYTMASIMLYTGIKPPQDLGEKKSFNERFLSFLSSQFFCLHGLHSQFLLLPGLIFPLLLPVSPLIFICVKVNALLKPRNSMLKAQAAIGSRGESILEAAPQFALQCYIILLAPLQSPGLIKWASISTSALTLSLQNIEHYVTVRIEEKKGKSKKEEFEGTFTFGPMSILKNISVFLPASLFKILAVTVIVVFFRVNAIYIIGGYILVLNVCLEITRRCYNLKGWDLQLGESLIMSWLTITNLGRGKDAALCRLLSTLYWTIAHTITFTAILVICNTDPGILCNICGSI